MGAHVRRRADTRFLGFVGAFLYGAVRGQGGTGAGSTEAGRVDSDQTVGFTPGAGQGRPAAHLGHDGVDLGGPAMARIARDYGYTLAELRKL